MTSLFPATAMPDSDWWRSLWPKPEAVLGSLGIEPGMDIVDLCCGDGLFTVPLAQMARHVIAIDLDAEVIARLKAQLAAIRAANCDVILGDAYEIGAFVRSAVDFVLMANTFHGVPDKPRLAHAVASVLKPGGRFAVINWHRRPREETIVLGQPRGPKTETRMQPEDVAAAVLSSGLNLVQVVELPPYHYGAVFKRTPS